jgi:hypothetical protein
MSFSRTGLPPATTALPLEALCARDAAAIAAASPDAAATRSISSAALLSPPDAFCVVTSISRISSTLANWFTVRTR